ncbi:hypothetical protein GYB59_03545 [bacterium]|nr:hypothetical protein [bacterium]
MRVFAEPMAALSDIDSLAGLTKRDQKLGAFPNWYLGLTEMYLRNPHCEAYAMFQDDLLLAPATRDYLEDSLWPAPEIGVVSLYCPSHEHRPDFIGFRAIDWGWKAWGALAYVFSNPGIRTFLSDRLVLDHRHHGPADGARNIDSVVGSWCKRTGLPYLVHVPSLVQHVGNASTIWPFGTASGKRRAADYDEQFAVNKLNLKH